MEAVDLVVTEFIALAIICVILLQYYAGPMVRLDVLVSVYLSWVVGLSGLLLLPYDISVAINDNMQSQVLDSVWKFVYWSSFALAWFILPVQMEYHKSGHFTPLSKFLDSLCRHITMGMLAALAGVVYIIYMVSTTGLSLYEVVGFSMACSNTYGVCVIIFLLGNGLAALPRRLWEMSDDTMELRRLYISATGIESAYQDARYDLEDCEFEVAQAVQALQNALGHQSVDQQVVSFLHILQEKVSNFGFAGRSSTRQHMTPIDKERTKQSDELKLIPDKKSLVDLHARLIRSQIRAGTCDRRWRLLIENILNVERAAAILADGSPIPESPRTPGGWCSMDVSSTTSLPHSASLSAAFILSVKSFLYTAYRFVSCRIAKLYYRFKSPLYKLIAVLATLLSIIILWSELVLSTDLHSPIGLMIGAYDGENNGVKRPILVQVITFASLAYISLCTYWSLFRINFGWAYSLQGPQQSAPSSLIFNAQYFSRLQFSLGYNFLMTLNAERLMSLTAFSSLMQNIKLVPVFGSSFLTFVPILMILVAAITLLNVLPRILNIIGIESEDPVGGPICFFCSPRGVTATMSDSDRAKYDSGKMIVNSELKQANLQRIMKENLTNMKLPEHDDIESLLRSKSVDNGRNSDRASKYWSPVTRGKNGYSDVRSDDDDTNSGRIDDEELDATIQTSYGGSGIVNSSTYKKNDNISYTKGALDSKLFSPSGGKPVTTRRSVFDIGDDDDGLLTGRYAIDA